MNWEWDEAQGNPSLDGLYCPRKEMPREPIEINENVPLAPLTTLGVGGNARFFAKAISQNDIEHAILFARSRNLALFVLGGGSNLVVSDRGWDGLVLQIGIGGIDQSQEGGRTLFDVGAGVDWDALVAHSISVNCAGIECLSGIPGSVGGTPVQNVGAYGQEVSETIVSVLAYDLVENRFRDLSAADCGFSYRASIFNTTQGGRYVIARVTYALAPGNSPSLRYGDLQKYFAGQDAVPTLVEVREAVRSIRASKGMLISPGNADNQSAGSFFKNPVLSEKQFNELMALANQRGLQVPSYPALSRQRKMSAAWLVESSGFVKGYTKGNVGISSKHALALVNRGGASTAEVIALKDEIQAGVEHAWRIHLQPEPVFVGF